MNFLTKFSNSWGHLIMSIVLIATGLVLILTSSDGTMRGVGVSLIMTSSSYWFVNSAVMHSSNIGNGGGSNTNVPTQNSPPNP